MQRAIKSPQAGRKNSLALSVPQVLSPQSWGSPTSTYSPLSCSHLHAATTPPWPDWHVAMGWPKAHEEVGRSPRQGLPAMRSPSIPSSQGLSPQQRRSELLCYRRVWGAGESTESSLGLSCTEQGADRPGNVTHQCPAMEWSKY